MWKFLGNLAQQYPGENPSSLVRLLTRAHGTIDGNVPGKVDGNAPEALNEAETNELSEVVNAILQEENANPGLLSDDQVARILQVQGSDGGSNGDDGQNEKNNVDDGGDEGNTIEVGGDEGNTVDDVGDEGNTVDDGGPIVCQGGLLGSKHTC